MANNDNATVWVGSKLQCKLHLDLYSYANKDGEERRMARKGRFTIAGAAVPRGADLTGFKMPEIVYGYALTQVPKGHWEEWIRRNKDVTFIRSGAVFAEQNLASAKARAKEYAELKTGFEPLVPGAKGTPKPLTNDDAAAA